MSGYFEYFHTTIEDICKEVGNKYDNYLLFVYGRYDYTRPETSSNYTMYTIGRFYKFKDMLKDEQVLFIDEDAREICLEKDFVDLNLNFIWDEEVYND